VSRNYANILTAIWRDPDWRKLSGDAQRTYLLLFSQPDITAAGVLALTVGRWASCADNTSPGSIRADLAELEDARFIVVDYEYEELLVRTFVKWDGGYTNPKRKPIISRSAHETGSPRLRAALAAEFGRLGLPAEGLAPTNPPPDRPPHRHPDSPSGALSTVAEPSTSRERPSWDKPTSAVGYAQVNSLSDSQSDRHPDRQSPSDGVVVTKGPYLVPQPTTRNPQPTAPAALPAVADGASPTQRSKAITDAYYAVEPLSKWPAINGVVLKAVKTGRWTDTEIHDAMQRLAADRRSVTVETLRYELTGPPVSRASPRSGDIDLQAAMARARAREEAS